MLEVFPFVICLRPQKSVTWSIPFAFAQMMLGTLKVLTDAHTIRDRPTRKDVKRFRNELLHERTLTSDHFIANQVKLILNKLYIYSETTSQSYVNYDSTKDHISIAIGKSLLRMKEEKRIFKPLAGIEPHIFGTSPTC